MSSIYLGVYIPEKPYQKIKIENVDLEKKTETLKSEACKVIGVEEIEFVYCGDILNNEEILKDKGIRNGSMIHVILKNIADPETPVVHEPFTEYEVQELLGKWRSVDASNFQKCRQPEFMKNVLDAHPEIRNDLWVLSVLKDPILLSSMQQPETIRNVAEKHRVMIEASITIISLLNSKKISKTSAFSPTVESALDDPLSDSSSSDDNASPSTSSGSRAVRRITSDQLASALGITGQSYNSLSNISQRNATAETTTSQPSTSTTAPTNRITSSMFMNALSEVMLNQRRSSNRPPAVSEPRTPAEPMDTTPAAEPVQTPLEAGLAQYQAELNQMRELGLHDTQNNLQALMVCNGNVEQAINLVFSELNN